MIIGFKNRELIKIRTIFVRSKYHAYIKNVALVGDKVSPCKIDGPDSCPAIKGIFYMYETLGLN